MNEFFRFSILRPFQKIDSNKTRSKLIEVVPPKFASRFYTALKSAKNAKNYQKMLELAKAFRSTEEFVKDTSKLSWPVDALDNWLAGKDQGIPHSELLALVESTFKKIGVRDWKKWVLNKNNQKEIAQISDSIIAVSIGANGDPDAQRVRPRLIRAMRICSLLVGMANEEKELSLPGGISRALSAMVLLPDTLFPLPPANIDISNREAQKQFEAANNKIKHQQRQLVRLVERLNDLMKAKAELTQMHALSLPEKDLSRTTLLEQMDERREALIATPDNSQIIASVAKAASQLRVKRSNFWMLDATMAKALSKSTKDALTDLGLDLKNINVQTAAQRIQESISNISRIVSTAKPQAQPIKIGSAFLSGRGMFPPPPHEPIVMRPAPGSVDIQVPSELPPPPGGQPSVPSGKGDVQPIGYEDLFLVREEISKYLPGEVADIENVLKGESKTRTHERSVETDTTTQTTTTRVTDSERDLQSTDQSQLQTTAQQSLAEKMGVQVGVQGSYSGPGFEIRANAGFTYDRATQESTTKAMSITQDVVDKTVTKIHEATQQMRSQVTKELVKDVDVHSFDSKSENTVGIYRWVDKFHKVEVVNIGRRLMFEFVIPEPAAFYKFAQSSLKAPGVTMTEPDPPAYLTNQPDLTLNDLLGLDWTSAKTRALTPADLTEENYMFWVEKYNVQDVTSPPPETKVIGLAISEKPQATGNEVIKNIGQLTVEDGYEASVAHVGGTIIPNPSGYTRVSVGTKFVELRLNDPNFGLNSETGNIPITVIYYNMSAIGITVEITCNRTLKKFADWQLKTFTSIMNAYEDLKSKYDEQVASAQSRAAILIQGRNPDANREIEKTELKKDCLSLITGQYYDDFNAMQVFGTPPYPQPNLKEASAEGSYIQFFEQAFEWTNISYLFYPYFWGRRSQWVELLNCTDNDPKFEKFLQAGAARVLVPARPSYEKAILNYLETGELWDGGDPPHVGSDLFVSIVDSIKEDYGRFSTNGPGKLSVTNNSPAVKGTGTFFTVEDDENREIFINGKTYRIKQVVDTDQIILSAPYADPSDGDIAYELGLQYVGQSWEVKFPTPLVWLQNGPDLPDFTKP